MLIELLNVNTFQRNDGKLDIFRYFNILAIPSSFFSWHLITYIVFFFVQEKQPSLPTPGSLSFPRIPTLASLKLWKTIERSLTLRLVH